MKKMRKRKRMDGRELVKQEVQRISKEEVRPRMKMMKSANAAGPNNILVEVWGCLWRMGSGLFTQID